MLARAVVWGLLDVNPAKQGVENPQRRRNEKRRFESWEEIEAVTERLEARVAEMVLFAAATGIPHSRVAGRNPEEAEFRRTVIVEGYER